MKQVFQYALDRELRVLVIQPGTTRTSRRRSRCCSSRSQRRRRISSRDRGICGGGGFGNMPRYRVFGTRVLHPLVFSLAARKRVTESTNGFRAFRTALLRDPRIDWRQPWLDRYELEPYLLLKAIRLGYRHVRSAGDQDLSAARNTATRRCGRSSTGGAFCARSSIWAWD